MSRANGILWNTVQIAENSMIAVVFDRIYEYFKINDRPVPPTTHNGV